MQYYFNEIETFIMKTQLVDYPENIKDKVEYFLQDGKRLRPILCIIFSGIDNVNINISLEPQINKIDNIDNNTDKIIYTIASVIEQIHCLSLVLDDLPEMDNDILRRGKESFHFKYGTEYTNFFIYYMFNHIGLSLNILLDSLDTNLDTNTKYDIEIFNRINNLFTYNLNMLIDGQYVDTGFSKSRTQTQERLKPLSLSNIDNIENIDNDKAYIHVSLFKDEMKIILELLESNELDLDISIKFNIELNIELNMKKTSSLFNLSICTGFLLQLWKKKENLDTYDNQYKQLSIWSNILGYMFQISDDILDMEDDEEKGNPNICQVLSKEKTCRLLKKGCEWLFDNINNINCNKLYFNLDTINNIIEKILKRIEK